LLNSGGMMITGTPNVHSESYRSEASKKVHIYEYDSEELKEIKNSLFSRVLHFSMSDEVIHTGFSKMAFFSTSSPSKHKLPVSQIITIQRWPQLSVQPNPIY